jgi:peptide deformylase
LDTDFVEHEEVFDGIASRVIQHEYDHLEGVLFIDKVSSLKKMLLKKKLSDISKGNIEIDYKMSFSKPANKRR